MQKPGKLPGELIYVKTDLVIFRKQLLILPLITFCHLLFPVENSCGLKNTSFRNGEHITYKIFYTLGGVYIGAGEVSFSCALETFNAKTVYHLTAVGKSYSFYDNFFKVRDKYESIIDTASLLPYKFTREVNEGDLKKYESIAFDKTANTAITNHGVYKVTECVQDVLSAMYYARNISFEQVKPGEKIPLNMFLDDQLYHSYIRYMGREIVKTKFGKFHAIRFKALLIKGTMFEEGEKMTVWVSDDQNHIPLRVESSITVGSVKADMMNLENSRLPLSSRIKNP